MEINNTTKKIFSGEKISFFLLLAFTFLLPLVFSPAPYINFFYSKSLLFFGITFLTLFFFIFKVFKEGRYQLTTHPLFLTGLLIPVWYLISSFLSVNSSNSFMGLGIETDTLSFVSALFLFAFLISYLLRSKDKIFLIYFALASSYLFLAIFHILRFFFGPNFLSFNLFLSSTSNTIGKWNEMAIFSGVILLLSLLSIEFLKLARGFKIFSWILLGISTFFLAVTNFLLIAEYSFRVSFFTLIGIFALVFFVYFLSSSYEQSRKENEDLNNETRVKRRIPIASFIILLISIIFTFAYPQIGSYVSRTFGVSSYEERPTWSWTTLSSWGAIKNRPFTGYGPNNFNAGWNVNKPASVNNSVVWNNDFGTGVGYIPSTVTTTGPLGLILWLIFIALFKIMGVKALFMNYRDRFSHYLTLSAFLVSLFLWIVAILYTPTTVILILTFLFTGIFFGSMIREGVVKEKTLVFENSKQKTFISILFLVLILVGSIFWSYTLGQRFASTVYASKGAIQFANAQSEADLITAQNHYAEAIQLSAQDSYLRAISNIALARARIALSDEQVSVDQRRLNFISSYQTAFSASNGAINTNKSNYQNYLSRGAVSESLISLDEASRQSLNLSDQYQEAKSYYEQARAYNPTSPLIPLLLARLEAGRGNAEAATELINTALEMKPNYSEAFLLLAQIQFARNDAQTALNTLLTGSLVAPDPSIFFSLGTVQYNNRDYISASDSFSKAVSLDPLNIEIRAYLAYSFYNSGRVQDAIAVLNTIKQIDPRTETEVNNLIGSFERGENNQPAQTSTLTGTSTPTTTNIPAR
jgi:tetratricopeptide (TPR) repeat protein